MPRSAQHDEDSESRTASIAAKRSHSRRQGQVNSSSSPQLPVGSNSESLSDRAAMGNVVSHSTQQSPSQTAQSASPSRNYSTEAPMASTSQGLGNNRLATGFRKPQTVLPEGAGSAQSAHDSSSGSAFSPAGSLKAAIEISSDEDESSEGGGMVINLDDGIDSDGMVIDDEEGEIFSSEDEAIESYSHARDVIHPSSSVGHAAHHLQLQAELQQLADALPNSPPTPPAPVKGAGSFRRLADLTPEELERQLKYALFDLEPDQIDLARPAVCLGCLQEGHTEESCPEKICLYCAAAGEHSSRLCPQVRRCSKCRERGHTAESCSADLKVTTIPCDLCGALGHHEEACPQRFFPFESTTITGSLKLWVSCCICASKSHLVGDCPDADRAATIRWSLKAFAPSQITNLSLEAGTRQREKQAANRGLRPDGLRIKGRAGVHTAGFAGSASPSDDEDDSDERFLGPRVPNRQNVNRGNFTFRHAQRPPGPAPVGRRDDQYDRYEPSDDRRGFQSRPPNNWYSTDSFGRPRPRSRSPPSNGGRNGEPWNRSGDSRRRSRSPNGFDGQRSRQRRSPSPRYHGGSGSASVNVSKAPTGLRGGASNQLKAGMTVQLPVRRGSNNAAQQGSDGTRANLSKRKRFKKGKNA